jgi:hypothetical protein
MSRTFNRSPGSRYNSKLDASFQLAVQNGDINWPPVLAILTDVILWAAIGTIMLSLARKFH